MSSAPHDAAKAPAGDALDKTSTPNSQLEKHTDAVKAPTGDTLDRTPTPSSQQLEKQTDTVKTRPGHVFDNPPTPSCNHLQKQTYKEGTFESQVVEYPEPLPFFLLMLAICISIFLVALDRTIITTVSGNLLLSRVLLICRIIRRYPISLISFTPTMMSAGTRVHTSSPPVLFYRYMDAYMACSTRNGYS